MELYVLTNAAIPGLIKVGMTTKTANVRAGTLTASAAVPEDFQVASSYKFPEGISYKDLLEVERKAHEMLSEFRYSDNKEFFTCTTDRAGTVIEQLQREAKGNLDRGLTITGQPRQGTLATLLQGDRGSKKPLFDTIKPRDHWHVWIAVNLSENQTTTLVIIPFTYWTKAGARARANREKISGKYSTTIICDDPLCPDRGKNGPKENEQ